MEGEIKKCHKILKKKKNICVCVKKCVPLHALFINLLISMYLMKKPYLLLLFLLVPLVMRGQITGVVVDNNGAPLMGVVVQSADGNISTTTDFDGYFELGVAEGTPLEVAFLGYKKTSVPASNKMRIVLQQKGAKPKMPNKEPQEMPWSMFVLANGMTSFPLSPAVGVTVGMVRRGGWYVSAMTGFGFRFEDRALKNGYEGYWGSSSQPFYTGKSSKQTMSVTAGGLARLGKAPVYVYLGAGWSYKSITFQTNNGKWVAYVTEPASNWSPLHGMALETGLLANIKGFALSVGYEAMVGLGGEWNPSAAHEIKIGLGGMFDCKGRKQK